MNNKLKILAIGAHPDDIEIYMYGLLRKFKCLGNNVYNIILNSIFIWTILPKKAGPK